MTTATDRKPWTHRFLDGWWCVYLSTGELGAKFVREGDALTYIDMAHRGIHPQHCGSCAAPLTTYIVIKQWINRLDEPTEYRWDGRHHTTHADAVSAGFDAFKCDDFNIGTVHKGQLTWFGWMDRELPDYDRTLIQQAIGLEKVR